MRLDAGALLQFTCFTGTEVQILTLKALVGGCRCGWMQELYSVYLLYWCFTGKKVQILTLKVRCDRWH
jgi:hypothetical protein